MFWERTGEVLSFEPVYPMKRGGIVKQLQNVQKFVERFRARMKFGELSRMPLQLLRFELREEYVECEWIARRADAWDADISRTAREDNETFQALQDSIKVREMLFAIFPEVRSAVIRVYRQPVREPPDLIILGVVCREDEAPRNIKSLVMRAKLFGFHFYLNEGVLEPMQIKQRELELAT